MKYTAEEVRDWHLEEVRRLNSYRHHFPNDSTVLAALIMRHQSMADAIDAHLLSQDAEIERLSQESAQQFIRARDWAELSGKNEDRASLAESRLAAATAEIEQLQAGLAKHVNRVCELQDRLAVANALLGKVYAYLDRFDPNSEVYDEVESHLQAAGAGDRGGQQEGEG